MTALVCSYLYFHKIVEKQSTFENMKTLSKWTRATHSNNISGFDLGGRGGFFVLVSNELRGALPPPPGQECESGTWNIGNKKKTAVLNPFLSQLSTVGHRCETVPFQAGFLQWNESSAPPINVFLSRTQARHTNSTCWADSIFLQWAHNPIGCLPISCSVLLSPVWPILRWVIVISLFCDRDRNVSECCRNQFLYRWYPSASAKFKGFESSVHESFSSVHLLPQKVH